MPSGVYVRKPFSEDWKKNLSLSKVGNKYALGHKQSKDTKLKLRLINTGKKYPFKERHPLSEETKKKMVKTRRKTDGYKQSEEAKIKISNALKGKKTGPQTEEHKRKMVETRKATGSYDSERHYNWQGGKSFEPYSVDWTKTLKRSIRERDKYTCRMCDEEGVVVHHIDYNKKNCNPGNLVTLCLKCHGKIHNGTF